MRKKWTKPSCVNAAEIASDVHILQHGGVYQRRGRSQLRYSYARLMPFLRTFCDPMLPWKYQGVPG